jgi:hypothetical protein
MTREEELLFIVGAMLFLSVVAGGAAWLCDWLEKKYPPQSRRDQ